MIWKPNPTIARLRARAWTSPKLSVKTEMAVSGADPDFKKRGYNIGVAM